MKKKLLVVILSLCVTAGLAAGLMACEKKGNTDKSTDESTEEMLESYYGCPNSKRIRRLSLKKKKV